jgi:selenocysteine lyase/cysteine desulfurase
MAAPSSRAKRRTRCRTKRIAAVADFLGASSPDEIKFGYNMTTLTLHLGRSIGATLRPGDEIVVTTLDHEANVSTWEAMAADRGLTVRKVDIREDDVTLDLEDLESKLSDRTKLVAVGYASNAVGTINPIAEIVARAHEVGALTFVDAVAYAPHAPIDVQAIDTDLLVCSAYKWFGPHLGALYGKAEVLDALPRSRSGRRRTGSRRGRRPSSRSPVRWPRPSTCATSGGDMALRPELAGARNSSRACARSSTTSEGSSDGCSTGSLRSRG